MSPENIGVMAESLLLCGTVETSMGWPRIVSERGQGREQETLQRREVQLLFAQPSKDSPSQLVFISSTNHRHNPPSSINKGSTSIPHPEIPWVLLWKCKTQWKLLAPTQPSLKAEM